jgi:hypothetical protein
MTKTKDNPPQLKETKAKELKDKETKEKEPKGKSNLVGRVKKVIKKSRRKLGEEKFEKELQRTIEFLAQLRAKLDDSHGAKASDKAPAKVGGKKLAPKAGKKVERGGARNAPKKAQPDKKSVKKPAGNGVGKKRGGLQFEDAAPAAEPRAALQVEARSKER